MENSSHTHPSRSSNQPTSDPDHSVGEAVGRRGQAAAEHLVATPAKDILARLQQYAHEKPDVAVCWCFGLGIIVGWKLRS
ncbi:hypothetical protein [Aporhodopirellula aestuarii]|uniref:Uncharacterized protein n=1 Tax=Aporhodopirellula aestuarii TaxID=2950107 RepID=A0ABT0U7C6_9BACT|nr:hypothetical protein [Aporhodopirellula aestuarii]MCM2372853.1 hypothetical protein [Aporhodopirellula aestuarii]